MMATEMMTHQLLEIYNGGIPCSVIVDPGKDVLYQTFRAQKEKRDQETYLKNNALSCVPDEPVNPPPVIPLSNIPNFHMFWPERLVNEMGKYTQEKESFDRKQFDKLTKDSQFHLNLDKSHKMNRNHTKRINSHKEGQKYGGKMFIRTPQTKQERRQIKSKK